MAIKRYTPNDVNETVLRGQTIAVIGYGNQGHAHALNLRDEGLQVLIGARKDSVSAARAREADFTVLPIDAAAGEADLIVMALPDDAAPAVYKSQIAGRLRGGQTLGFIHGFNVHYQLIQPARDLDVVMVAPKGTGVMLRQAYQCGSGLACLVAVHQDASGRALHTALGWAGAIGAMRAGVMETTFAAETETDLFGEQAAVVGGVIAIMRAAFETLIESGYEPEHAYLECVHEVKFVVDLVHHHGIEGMRRRISSTAAFGARLQSPRLQQALKPQMERILQEIRSGGFKEQFLNRGPDRQAADSSNQHGAGSLLEAVGGPIRAMMDTGTTAEYPT